MNLTVSTDPHAQLPARLTVDPSPNQVVFIRPDFTKKRALTKCQIDVLDKAQTNA
jgi:hypothetical protein